MLYSSWPPDISMLNLCSVVVFHISMVNRRMGPWYMCILLYVKLIWCSGIPYICGQLHADTSTLSICAFCCMLNLFHVVVLHRCMGQLEDGGLGICAFCYM